MPEMQELLMALLAAASVGAAASGALYVPLRRVVRLLCGTDEAAAFWTSYSVLFLLVLPILGVAWTTWTGNPSSTPADALGRTLSYALAGLVAALLTIGMAVMKGVRFEQQQLRGERDKQPADPWQGQPGDALAADPDVAEQGTAS